MIISIALIATAGATAAHGRDTDTTFWQPHDESSTRTIDHGDWQEILDSYLVENTASGIHRFDYGAVTAAHRQRLDGYLDQLSAEDPRQLSRDEQFAFWINLYNAVTVALVLDHYPIGSIRDIGGLFRKGPWERELIAVAGQALTLDDVEHRILRPIWQDPRIHYAVNCASLGCPDLAARAYTAARLEGMLDAQARAYVNHPRGVDLREDGAMRLSSIYDWYREDFGNSREQLIAHLRRYADTALSRRLAEFDGNLRYRYDWSLNDVRAGRR